MMGESWKKAVEEHVEVAVRTDDVVWVRE